ncbi:DUF3455 domain-containing protein [Tumidithrix helvetica PCC 7403]|uniref:DUF3455 domain-containing protein n=1 Tax=Tumidithrix helvetica TaxID=3457545 RepID=UPI003C7F8DEE
MKTFLSKQAKYQGNLGNGLGSARLTPCLLGALLGLGFVGSAIAATVKPIVPEKLQVSPGEELLFKASAQGAQIYTCKANDKNKFAWTFKAPEAYLFDDRGMKIIHHYGGPSWEYLDKSKVKAKVKAKVGAPDPTAIPWLLLEVTSHEGRGMMSNVTSIQRLNTSGGLAPTTTCNASNAGKEIGVGYEADYYFYGSTTVQGLW